MFLTICLVSLPVSAFAMWVTANQVTVMWDHNDKTGIVEGEERLVYRVLMTNTVTDPNKTNPVVVGETEDNTLVLTLTIKGKYRAGVKAVLQALNEDGVTWEDVGESEISWSDDPTVVKDGVIFGIRFYPAPDKPTGLTTG